MTGHSTNSALSIIIPVFNEEKKLPKILHWLDEKAFFKSHQVIVVDGGSEDGTLALSDLYPKVVFYTSPKGRAKQMNFGAQKAVHTTLYFLHVDSYPPKSFDVAIFKAQKKAKAGCFRMRFDSHHWALQISAFLTRFPSRFCRGGDQSLFIEKEYFQQLGGFDEEYVLCEDGEFIDRLYKEKSFVVIQKTLVTSARKFKKNGVLRLIYHHSCIHFLRAFGYGPKALKGYYDKYIR